MLLMWIMYADEPDERVKVGAVFMGGIARCALSSPLIAQPAMFGQVQACRASSPAF